MTVNPASSVSETAPVDARQALRPPVAADGSPVQMRLLDPQTDITAACKLFTDVFGAPMSEATWRWKYMEAPGSSHYHAVAMHAGSGEMLGHMGVIILPGVRGSQSIRMAHATDLMISPLARAGIGPDGVYRHIMHSVRHHAHDAGPDAPPLFMYGFPGQRPATLAMRLGIQRRLQICSEYTTASAAVEPAKGWGRALWDRMRGGPARLVAQAQAATPDAWSDSLLDPVWQRYHTELEEHSRRYPHLARPSTVKNGAYLRWRYLEHPLQQAALGAGETPPYTLWSLRKEGGDGSHPVEGWLITRQMAQPTVVDSCLPGGADAVAPALQALPVPSGGQPWVSWLQHPGAQARDTLVWATAMCGAQFHDTWPGPQFQPGDTDVF